MDVNRTAPHEHSFTYSVGKGENANTITAKCSAEKCSLPAHQATLTISAPKTGYYQPVITDVYGIRGDAVIRYYNTKNGNKTGDPLQNFPTDDGTYWAEITLGTAGNTATAYVVYSISGKYMPVISQSCKGPYDGNKHSITVTAPEGAVIKYRTKASGEYDLEDNPSFTEPGSYMVWFKVTKDGFKTVERSKTVEIWNAELTDVSVSQNGTLKYSGSAQTPAVITAATAKGNQTVTFTYSKTQNGEYSSTVPSITNVSESGTFYYKASAPNHNDTTGSFTVTMNKDTAPAVNVPTPDAVTYDPAMTLADIPLTGDWEWVTTNTVPTVKNSGYDAVLTVDGSNYDYSSDSGYDSDTNKVTRTVPLTVNKANNPATVSNTATVEKGRKTVDLNKNVNRNGAKGDVRYAFAGDDKGCILSDGILTSGNDTGSVTVNATVTADANYKALAATPITVTITDNTPSGGGSGGGADTDNIQQLIDKINALPDPNKVTVNDENAIKEAREAYNILSDTEKQDSRLTQSIKDKLEDCETALEKAMKDKEDQEAADKVSGLVEALPADPAEASEADAQAAFDAYMALTDAQKALITDDAKQKVAAYKFYYEARYAEAQKVKMSSVKAKKGRKAAVKWKKNKDADGYLLCYKAKGVKAKKVNIKSYKTVNKTVTKLKAGKVYTFKIRPYTKVENPSTGNMKTVYGKWSKAKKIRAKK